MICTVLNLLPDILWWMLTLLFGALLLLTLIQPTPQRFFGAFVLLTVTLVHEICTVNLDGLVYYASAALLDLLALILINLVSPLSKTIITLQKICVVSAFANCAGWMMWMTHQSPIPYQIAFISIYAWIVLTLAKKEEGDVGRHSMGGWHSDIHFNIKPFINNRNESSGKI